MKTGFQLIVGVLAAACCASAAQPQNLLIEDVRIASPELAAATAPQDVLIRNGRISLIGSANADPAAIKTIPRISGRGLFLSPGFIDSHVHLQGVPGMSFEDAQANPEIVRQAAQQIPRSYLYHGFTSLIDLNAEPGTIAQWNQAPVRPRAYFCGGAPFMDGYPMTWVPEQVRYRALPYFLWDPGRTDTVDGVDAADHTPAAVVRRMKADGAVCIKTHFEPGFRPGQNLPTPPAELIRSLVSEADTHGLPVLLHANSERAYRFGLDTGVHGFAHGIWKWETPDGKGLPPSVSKMIEQAASRRVAIQPTVQVLYGERDLFKPGYLSSGVIASVLPSSLLRWYETERGQVTKDGLAAVPYVSELLQAGRWDALNEQPIARVKSMLAELARRNARLIFGSDTPSDQTFANPPGLNGYAEIQHWLDAGVKPREMLRALTIANAKFFNLGDQIGTVEVGKRADLLLLSRDPLTDREAFGSIVTVIADGRAHERESLSALAATEAH